MLVAATGGSSNLSCWEALLKGWQPYCMGWKKVWWECVACPEDVEDEQAFRQGTATCAYVSPLTAFLPYLQLAATCNLECCFPWVSHVVAQLYECRLCCDALVSVKQQGSPVNAACVDEFTRVLLLLV